MAHIHFTVTVGSGTINGGTETSGEFRAGRVIQVTADDAPDGEMFDKWTGQTGRLASISQKDTTLTMPDHDVAIAATYREVPDKKYALTVESGTGSGGYTAGTAWVSVTSTQPITGFELFGTAIGSQLAGYSPVNLAATSGILPKLERDGWTGIVLLNHGQTAAQVTLQARDDQGGLVAEHGAILESGHKAVDVAQAFFPEQDISAGTYLLFVADQPVTGFQLNGSTDGTLLDGIPALGATHVGETVLYFPHVAVQ